jgi:hypothetical protein
MEPRALCPVRTPPPIVGNLANIGRRHVPLPSRREREREREREKAKLECRGGERPGSRRAWRLRRSPYRGRRPLRHQVRALGLAAKELRRAVVLWELPPNAGMAMSQLFAACSRYA